MINEHDSIVSVIEAGTVTVVPRTDLLKKLSLNRPLRVKLGADPTSPNLHLGHAVVLRKLKDFQDLGHEIQFIIGDFTARIGDPTEKSATRPVLSVQEIESNMKTYFEQVGRILDMSKIRIYCNSEWLSPLTAADVVKLCSKVTVARIIEREDFQKRLSEQKPIGFHELLYPLFQAYDSVVLQSDIELGGTDQTFNLLMGRYLQEQCSQEAQVVITMPLLEGLDGVQKMSKSLGNAIGITEPANEAYAKLMSISDDLMWRYFALLLRTSPAEIADLQTRVARNELHPMALKKDMARGVISTFWSKQEAEEAAWAFQEKVQNKDYSHVPVMQLGDEIVFPVWIVDLLKHLGAVSSSSDARRLIEAGAVSCNGAAITDFKATITVIDELVLKVGKHRVYRLKR